MPRRRTGDEPKEVPAKRPLRDMLACAMCGQQLAVGLTSAGTSAMCPSCGHTNDAQIADKPAGESESDGSHQH